MAIESHPVIESTVVNMPFGDLKEFYREDLPEDAPRLLVVAPMSGHYATLLRGTVERMLENYRVFVTDWAGPHCNHGPPGPARRARQTGRH